MLTINLNKYKKRFKAYVRPYLNLGGEAYTLKVKHTGEVCHITQKLICNLGLSQNEEFIAILCALFHDVGRFYQYDKYQTFNDSISCDHAQKSVEIIKDLGMLNDLEQDIQEIIYSSIIEHNKIEISSTCTNEHLPFIKLLRDSDKISNFPFFIKNYSKFNLPFSNQINQNFLQNVLDGKPIENKKIIHMEDLYLYHLSWMNDLYFKESVNYVLENKYIEQISSFLPRKNNVDTLAYNLKNNLSQKALLVNFN